MRPRAGSCRGSDEFVRTTAQHSIRKRKSVSRPGQPPSSHVGTLRRLIFFAYEPAKKNVMIGPTPFGDAAPELLLEQQHVAGTTIVCDQGSQGQDVVATQVERAPSATPSIRSTGPVAEAPPPPAFPIMSSIRSTLIWPNRTNRWNGMVHWTTSHSERDPAAVSGLQIAVSRQRPEREIAPVAVVT